MAASKRTGKATTEAKQKLIILALYPEPIGLTDREKLALEAALKTAGETSVESHESLETVVALVSEACSPRR